MVSYRWSQPQASEDAPMGTWPNKPGRPEIPLMVFAVNVLLGSRCNSFETKFKNVKLKFGLRVQTKKNVFTFIL
jgi:hypothetical protein